MFAGLISFLGGSVFRMIWGELSSWITKKQDHAQEIERMKLESALEAQRYERDMARLKLQSELAVKEVVVQTDAALQKISADAWGNAVEAVGRTTGIKFIDVWNGIIRPFLATMAISLIVAEVVRSGFVLTEWDRELMGAILGIYVADRTMSKIGK